MFKIIPKKFFFDRGLVMATVGRARAGWMGKAGAFIRRTARFLIRARGRVSRPGEAPTSHTGLLREHIYFALDPNRRSLVVGPLRFNQLSLNGAGFVSGAVPRVLEHGGEIGVVEEQLSGGLWVRKDLRSRRRQRPTRVRRVTIAPRPFMGPALAQNMDKIVQFWRGAVGRITSNAV